jgi:DNA-binding SARP family transcriptional activator
VLAALLLARGRVVADAQLSEFLWGWHPPTTMSAQIYTYVSRLRQRLAPEVAIVRRPPGYMLQIESAEFDYEQFERLTRLGHDLMTAGRHEDATRNFRASLDLWTGPPLANVTEFLASVDLPRLEEARTATLESRIEADLTLGRHAQLVPELTGLVTQYPMREQLRVQLMTALYRCERQADALSVFQEGRQVLTEELGVDPGAALTAAYQAILHGELGFDPQPAAVPAAELRSWQETKPAMLPPDVADFTGRDRQLTQLRDILRPGRGDMGRQPRQVLITGMAGVGKTALALRAAHACSDDFPEGQLYVDLGGTTARRVDPFNVLEWFLRALGTGGAQLPASLEERQQLYRSQLASRRMVVVLDDAADAAQVQPLLPGGRDCRVIVTSRARLTALAGARVIELGVLTDDEGLRLLARIVGAAPVRRDPEGARQLVARCDALPMAVRIAGARRAAQGPAAGELATLLADDARRLDDLQVGGLNVRESLHASYDGLDQQTQAAFRQLGVPRVRHFPAQAVARLLGLPQRGAEEVLETLVGARLLEVSGPGTDSGTRWYHFRGLVALFARERAAREDSAQEAQEAQEQEAEIDRAVAACLDSAQDAGWSLAVGLGAGPDSYQLGDEPVSSSTV